MDGKPIAICPKCGSDSQVWVNQITGVLTCHRLGCGNIKVVDKCN